MAMKNTFADTLSLLFRARLPILYVDSYEESRVLEAIRQVSADQARMRTVRPVWVWTSTQGFVSPDGTVLANSKEPQEALAAITKRTEPGVFVMLDLHAYLGEGNRPADPDVVRQLRDVAAEFQCSQNARVLILVSPVLRIPPELEKDITIVDFPLPNEQQLATMLDDMVATNTSGNSRIRIDADNGTRERLAKAALGLTLNEAANAFARAMVDNGVLSNDDIHVVLEEKRQAIRKSGLLEFVTVDTSLDDIRGLQNLKRWLMKRNNSWMDEAAAYGLPAPKGVLMTGIPG